VVSCKSVNIAFTVVVLSNLEVLVANIGNACLNANSYEMVNTTAGPELGSNAGKNIVISQDLCALKSSGAVWRAHLASAMTDLNFKPCQADLDVWMQPAVKPDGTKYYEYVLINADGILVIAHRVSSNIYNLSALYCLEEDPSNGKKYDTPDQYLSASIGFYMLPGNTSGK
jgi:hypothetical protein